MNTLKKIHEAATKSNKSEDLIEFFMVILQKKKNTWEIVVEWENQKRNEKKKLYKDKKLY